MSEDILKLEIEHLKELRLRDNELLQNQINHLIGQNEKLNEWKNNMQGGYVVVFIVWSAIVAGLGALISHVVFNK
jgi:hypothetical protein